MTLQVEEGTVNTFHSTVVAPPLPQQNSTEVHQQVGLATRWVLYEPATTMSCYIPASSLYCCGDNSTNAGGPPAWCQESEALSHTTPSSSFHLAGPQPLWGDCSEAAYHRWEALHQKPRGLVGRELGRPYQLTTRGRWAPGIHTSTCACLASVHGSLPSLQATGSQLPSYREQQTSWKLCWPRIRRVQCSTGPSAVSFILFQTHTTVNTQIVCFLCTLSFIFVTVFCVFCQQKLNSSCV